MRNPSLSWSRASLAGIGPSRGLSFSLLALLVIGGLPSIALPQTPPQGSYRDSCDDIEMPINGSGYNLKAICQSRRDGPGREETVLENAQQCVGDISNQNGTLTCSRGSFLHTCVVLALDSQPSGYAITAICLRRDHHTGSKTQWIGFPNACHDLVNDDAHLVCQ